MLILGRTASNAIKIKTEGNSPRTVECACCGCGCNTSPISELLDPPDQLIQILDAAVTATCNGRPPSDWQFYPEGGAISPGWYGAWVYNEIHILRWFSYNKCLTMNGDNAMNVISSGNCEKCAEPSVVSCEKCEEPPVVGCINQMYTINGTEFPCHSDIYDEFYPPVSPPAFLF